MFITDTASGHGQFLVEALTRDGRSKWVESFPNMVVNVGLQNMVGATLTNATRYTVWYLGLISAGGVINAADTMASHTGWTEATGYTEATRPVATLSSPTIANPSVTTNSAAAALFTINTSPFSISGLFLTSDNTKSGTSGLLFSAATFTGGNRTLYSTDVLRVTYTYSLARV